MSFLSIFDTVGAANEGATLELKHPETGETVLFEGKPIVIRLMGQDSSVYDAHLQAMINKSRRDAAKKGGKKETELDLEQSVKESCELYAKMTLGWDNMPDYPKFTEKSAYEVYFKFKDIRVQVGNFIADKANFIKAPLSA